MSDNETFVYPPSTPSTDNTNKKLDDIQEILSGLAIALNSLGVRMDNFEMRMVDVETRSTRTSKVGTPIRSTSPVTTDKNKKEDLNLEDLYPATTPTDDQKRETSVESLLKLGGIFTLPNPLKVNPKNKDSKNNKKNETPMDKYEKKKLANQENTRKSILKHDQDRLKVQKNNKNNGLSNAVPTTYVKHVPEFKTFLEKLDPNSYREFLKAAITHERRYDTTLQAGSYVANNLVELIIDKNKVAKSTGKTFVSEIDDVFELKGTTLEELTPLIRVAAAPLDATEYEEQLKKYTTDGIFIRTGYHPRIFDFQSFSDNLVKFLEKFEDVITFLSGSNIVLPMTSKKELDTTEGTLQILYQALPANYCGKYLRQHVPYVSEENDDIISYLRRLRETHFTKGYKLFESIRVVSKSLVKDYPYNSDKYTKEGPNPVKTIFQKNKNGGQFPSKDLRQNLQTLLEETRADEELSPEDSLFQQEVILEQHVNRELEDSAEIIDSQLHALSLAQTAHKPIFDSKTGKSYVPKGCQNLVLFDTCFLDKNGMCKNSHDVKNVRETAMIMLERATKYLAATDPKKSTGGQPAANKKPSLNNFGSADTGGEESSSNDP